MYCKTLVVLGAGASLVAGSTPSGFTPSSNNDLLVMYGKTTAMNGAVVARASTASEPTIATKSQLNGTSYAVMMIDLDIPSTTNPHTFLHWVQTGLTASTKSTTMTTSNGTVSGFTLSNAKNTSAIVAYTQPNPPAKNPLSHRYTQVLLDTSNMSTSALSTLKAAAANRTGFNINTVLASAGLSKSVVAGNSFNVTNAGPASDGSTGSNSTSSSSSSGSGSNSGSSGSTSSSGSGSAASNNVTSSGAAVNNGTNTVSTSDAALGYAVLPMTVMMGLAGIFCLVL